MINPTKTKPYHKKVMEIYDSLGCDSPYRDQWAKIIKAAAGIKGKPRTFAQIGERR